MSSENIVKLLIMGLMRSFIKNKHKLDDILIEIKLVCKKVFCTLIDPKILKMEEERSLLQYIKQQTKKDWNWELIYRASEHGFKRDDFYKYCKDKSNTVVIVYNNYEQTFGGYAPCKWKKKE